MVGSGLATLAPNFYESISTKFESSHVVFRYEENLARDSAWLKILEKTIGSLVTTEALLDQYRQAVESRFKEKGYTVDKVMHEDRVLVPFDLARERLSMVYDPLFRAANAPGVIEFVIENNSSNGLEIDSITISTGVVVQDPLFVAVPSFPYKGECTMESAKGDNGGFIINCKDIHNKAIILPKNSRLRVLISQTIFPFVREESTFLRASFVNGGDIREDYYLATKVNKDADKEYMLILQIFSLIIFGLLFSTLLAPVSSWWSARKNASAKPH